MQERGFSIVAGFFSIFQEFFTIHFRTGFFQNIYFPYFDEHLPIVTSTPFIRSSCLWWFSNISIYTYPSFLISSNNTILLLQPSFITIFPSLSILFEFMKDYLYYIEKSKPFNFEQHFAFSNTYDIIVKSQHA